MVLGFAGLVSTMDMETGQTVVTITNEQTVKSVVWILFSLVPAALALLMGWLAYKYPIKK